MKPDDHTIVHRSAVNSVDTYYAGLDKNQNPSLAYQATCTSVSLAYSYFELAQHSVSSAACPMKNFSQAYPSGKWPLQSACLMWKSTSPGLSGQRLLSSPGYMALCFPTKKTSWWFTIDCLSVSHSGHRGVKSAVGLLKTDVSWVRSYTYATLTRIVQSHSMKNLACSDERWLYYQFSLPHLYIFFLKVWENVHFELGSERVKIHLTLSL